MDFFLYLIIIEKQQAVFSCFELNFGLLHKLNAYKK